MTLRARSASGFSALALTLQLCGCSPSYQTLRVDPKTDGYSTSTSVDPGGIAASVTTTDPRTFPVVLLITRSNIRPAGLEFTVRNALAQAGITNVYDAEEFSRYCSDRHLTVEPDHLDGDVIRKVSTDLVPVLVVNMSYMLVGEARMHAVLQVVDGRTGEVLLRVDHPRLVWSSFDGEALYPVLNQLRGWIKSSEAGAT
jgi:hypothetical protein